MKKEDYVAAMHQIMRLHFPDECELPPTPLHHYTPFANPVHHYTPARQPFPELPSCRPSTIFPRTTHTRSQPLPALPQLPPVVHQRCLPLRFPPLRYDPAEARQTALDDWAHDTKRDGVDTMNYNMFAASMFEMADLWVDGLDLQEYVGFLETLGPKGGVAAGGCGLRWARGVRCARVGRGVCGIGVGGGLEWQHMDRDSRACVGTLLQFVHFVLTSYCTSVLPLSCCVLIDTHTPTPARARRPPHSHGAAAPRPSQARP